jgi:hypothetical protein
MTEVSAWRARFVIYLANVVVVLGLLANSACGDPWKPQSWDDRDYKPPVSVEPDPGQQLVVPISGDSAPPVDEVMVPPIQLVGLRRWPLSSPEARPIAIYVKREDGDVDVSVITADGLDAGAFRDRVSRPTVLVPLGDASRAAIENYLRTRQGSGLHATHARLHAYCVEAGKAASPKGTVFIMGGSAARRRFAPIQGLLRIADRAVARGMLRPQGEPFAYGRFIAQYAVWTKLENWTERRFIEEMVARSRQSVQERHGTWTTETEQTLRALAPGRWRDVRTVIAAAGSTRGQEGGNQ